MRAVATLLLLVGNLVVALLYWTLIKSAPNRPVILTDCGRVQGFEVNNVNVYKGIPYASAERWRLPESLVASGRCWAPRTLNASSVGPQCVNLDGEGVEDCLTLSVWAPRFAGGSDSAQLRPCMVYFHGGDLTEGSTGLDFSKLAAHGEGVVIIDVNYRLSVAGFLSIQQMASESIDGTTGVFGFYDMLEALRWTKRNAHVFGGDPSRVTIFGQSSGGTAVMALLASPLASGLFSGAMSLSGSPNISMSSRVQHKQHAHIVQRAGCAVGDDAAVMACLRNESLQIGGGLLKATPKGPDHATGTASSPSWSMDNIFDIPRYRDGLRAPGLAIVDGHVVRESVQKAYELGRNDVPVIFSSMAQECGQWPAKNVSNFSATQFRKYLDASFALQGLISGDKVAAEYANEIAESPQKAFDSIAADIEMTCGNIELAVAAGHGFPRSPVYSVYNAQHLDDKYWAFHGSDLYMAALATGPLAEALRDVWHEFAWTGQVKAWQTVNSAAPWVSVVLRNNGTVSSVGWKEGVCRFWRDAGFGPEFWWSN